MPSHSTRSMQLQQSSDPGPAFSIRIYHRQEITTSFRIRVYSIVTNMQHAGLRPSVNPPSHSNQVPSLPLSLSVTLSPSIPLISPRLFDSSVSSRVSPFGQVDSIRCLSGIQPKSLPGRKYLIAASPPGAFQGLIEPTFDSRPTAVVIGLGSFNTAHSTPPIHFT